MKIQQAFTVTRLWFIYCVLLASERNYYSYASSRSKEERNKLITKNCRLRDKYVKRIQRTDFSAYVAYLKKTMRELIRKNHPEASKAEQEIKIREAFETNYQVSSEEMERCLDMKNDFNGEIHYFYQGPMIFPFDYALHIWFPNPPGELNTVLADHFFGRLWEQWSMSIGIEKFRQRSNYFSISAITDRSGYERILSMFSEEGKIRITHSPFYDKQAFANFFKQYFKDGEIPSEEEFGEISFISFEPSSVN